MTRFCFRATVMCGIIVDSSLVLVHSRPWPHNRLISQINDEERAVTLSSELEVVL